MKPIIDSRKWSEEIIKKIQDDMFNKMYNNVMGSANQDLHTCSSNPYTDFEYKVMSSMFENKLKTMLPQLPKIVSVPQIEKQKRKHRKKRINKKWLKRYGVIYVSTLNHGEALHDTFNNVMYVNSDMHVKLINEYGL
jgi:hypothetical protein